jgi:hypothetical protein
MTWTDRHLDTVADRWEDTHNALNNTEVKLTRQDRINYETYRRRCSVVIRYLRMRKLRARVAL